MTDQADPLAAPAIPIGEINLGDLRRLAPFSRIWGYDRGTPVDRVYIEGFLERNAADIRGAVLEMSDSRYTRRFGGNRVTRSEALDVDEDSPEATIVTDLERPEALVTDEFDCIIFHQTLQYLYDVRAALGNLRRSLRPGGVLLATLPGFQPWDRTDWDVFWSFNSSSVRRLFNEFFMPEDVDVHAFGNVQSVTAYLWGMAAEELDREVFEVDDPMYELTITVRAVKRAA